ncbi:MAG: hypothetical protein WKF97_03585 [Chitinophagaceae bacterium]
MLKIRTFRAINDLQSCTRFAAGHSKVLLDYGVIKVTSSSTDWIYNPSVYVMVAEKIDTNELVGGIRIHVADGKTRLPMEDAISIVDTKVYGLIDSYTDRGTAELCGLWNSKSTAGLGIGSYFLMRAAISSATRLNLTTLFALCAPHTLNISVEKGFQIEKSIGNQGTFIYPKLDLLATSILIKDLANLPIATPPERKLIMELRNNPTCSRLEKGPKGDMEIAYNLLNFNMNYGERPMYQQQIFSKRAV